MHTTSLSSRARTSAKFATAGITALVATLAFAGPADAAGNAAGSAEPPRITVTAERLCGEAGNTIGFRFAYDDHVDGHVPQAVNEEISHGPTIDLMVDEVHNVNGDYFNSRVFPEEGASLDPSATYTYFVTISYDDGVAQTQSTTISAAGACAAPPTTAPVPDRFGLIRGHHGCGFEGRGAFVEWTFLDVADGHLPSGYKADLSEAGVVIESTGWTDLARTDGEDRTFMAPTDFLDIDALKATSYTLTVTINYDDGVNETHIETFDLAGLCGGRVNAASTPATPTTAPAGGGTLPATGIGDATWIVGAIAGLLTIAGAVLFAGARRSRVD